MSSWGQDDYDADDIQAQPIDLGDADTPAEPGLYYGSVDDFVREYLRHVYRSRGSKVCGYGYRSGFFCDHVEVTGQYYSVSVPDGGNRDFRVGPLYAISRHLTQGGDSGGPWFYGEKGMGIHSGQVSGRSAFSSLRSALLRFDLSLWRG